MFWEQFFHALRRGYIIYPHPNPGPAAYKAISILWIAVPALVLAVGIAIFVMSSRRREENQ